MEKTGKSPAALGFTAQPARKAGRPVYLKIFLATLKTKTEFVYAKQMWACEEDIMLNGGKVYGDYLLAALLNYDEKDMAKCRRTNLERLVWMAQTRLHTWYSD